MPVSSMISGMLIRRSSRLAVLGDDVECCLPAGAVRVTRVGFGNAIH